MVALKGTTDIGDQINKKIIGPLAAANKLADMPDFNDATKLGKGKEMVDRLTNLIAIFENPALDFSKNRADGDDILGDAYEYLMRHFATESGKSKGQFYTPAEVSRIMAKIIGISRHHQCHHRVRPHLRLGLAAAEGGRRSIGPSHALRPGEGLATSGLARMNMILHDNPTAKSGRATRWPTPSSRTANGQAAQDLRLRGGQPAVLRQALEHRHRPAERPLRPLRNFGVPPAKQGDYAYLLHIIRSLKSTGKGRVHPAARRAVPWQCRGRHPQEPDPPRLHQGHHRPACQPVLWHRHPGLHHRHRQRERPCPQGHLHDRRQQAAT
jgi:type I restriction enzyme M protein